jgi:integrase
MRVLCNEFLSNKDARLANGELSLRMRLSYGRICERSQIVEDLRAGDFEKLRKSFAKGVGLVTLGNLIQHAKIVFKFAHDAELIPHPLRFGPNFKTPDKRRLRAERQAKPLKLFEAGDLRKIIDVAKPQLKAMILLGINCGFGQTDCSMLPLTAMDLKTGWLNFPRPKTAVERRCPLWPETGAALQDSLANRRTPTDERLEGRFFINKLGSEYVRLKENGTALDGISLEFGKLVRGLEIKGTFYGLHHAFETIGGASRDQIATSAIMGHAPASNDMASVYRARIDDERLQAVVDHVRRWLWPVNSDTIATQDAG